MSSSMLSTDSTDNGDPKEAGTVAKPEETHNVRRRAKSNKYVAFTTLRPGNDLMVHMGSSNQLVPRLSRRSGVGGSRRFGSAKRTLRSQARQSLRRKAQQRYGERALVDDDGHTTIVKIGDQEDAGIKELLQALDPSRFKDSNRRERKVVLIQWKGNGLPVSHLAGHVSFTDTISTLVPKVNISICANEDNNIDLKSLRNELDKIIASGTDGEYPDYSMYEVRTIMNEQKTAKAIEDKPLDVPERFESLGRSHVERPAGPRRGSVKCQASVFERHDSVGSRSVDAGLRDLLVLDSHNEDGSTNEVAGFSTPKNLILPSTPNLCPTRRYCHQPLKARSASRIRDPDETPRSSRTPVSAYAPTESTDTGSSTSVALRAKLFEQKASEIAANKTPLRPKNFRFNVQPPATLVTPARSTVTPPPATASSAPVKSSVTEQSDDETADTDGTPKFKRQNSVRRSLRPFLKRRPQTPIRIPLAFLNSGSYSARTLPAEDDAPISRLAVDLAATPPREDDSVNTPITESGVSTTVSIQSTPNRRNRQNSVNDSETGIAENIARSISDDMNALNMGDSTSLVDEVFEDIENEDTAISTPSASPNAEEEDEPVVIPATPVIDYMDTITEEGDAEFVQTDTEDPAAVITKIFEPVHGSHDSLTDGHQSDIDHIGVIEETAPPSPLSAATKNALESSFVDYLHITEPSPDTDGFISVSSAKSDSSVRADYSELTESTQIPTDESNPLKSPPQAAGETLPSFESFMASELKETSDDVLGESALHKGHRHVVEYPEMDGFVVVDDDDTAGGPKNVKKAAVSVHTVSKVETDDDISAVVVPKRVSVTDRVKSLHHVLSQNEGVGSSMVPRKPWLNASKKAVINLATSSKKTSHSDSTTTIHESHAESVEKSTETRVLDDGSIETITTIETSEEIETVQHTVTEEIVEELVSTTITMTGATEDQKADFAEDHKNQEPGVGGLPSDVESAEKPVEAVEKTDDAIVSSGFSFKDLKSVLAKEITVPIVPPSPAVSLDTVESVVMEEGDLVSLPDEIPVTESAEPMTPVTAAGDAKSSEVPVPASKKRKNKKNKKNKH